MWEMVEWNVWEDYTEEETVGRYATEEDAMAAADAMTAALPAEVVAACGEDWGFHRSDGGGLTPSTSTKKKFAQDKKSA